MEKYQFTVKGMSCTGCEERVSNAAKRVEGVLRVDADHETGNVKVTADEDSEDDIRQAIHDAGYDVSA